MSEQVDSIRLFAEFCMNSIQARDVDPAIDYMNYIVDRMEFNEEQVLWLCFLYGVTYQLPSAYVLWNEMPDLELVDETRLRQWWAEKSPCVPFQTDKRKCKTRLVETVMSYQALVGKAGQRGYFDSLLCSDDPQVNFDTLWSPLKSIYCFGRFSIWNWAQALKHVAGYNIEPTRLMLGEPDSVSFTDGLAYAFGYTDRLTRTEVSGSGARRKVYYRWSEMERAEMEGACSVLKSMLGIDNFQLETLACAFKKIWRTRDSRYVGYYNDRIADDIRATASFGWDGIDWRLLWDARTACVPPRYLHGNMGVNRTWFELAPEEKVRL